MLVLVSITQLGFFFVPWKLFCIVQSVNFFQCVLILLTYSENMLKVFNRIQGMRQQFLGIDGDHRNFRVVFCYEVIFELNTLKVIKRARWIGLNIKLLGEYNKSI
jgi:hypothetical protein